MPQSEVKMDDRAKSEVAHALLTLFAHAPGNLSLIENPGGGGLPPFAVVLASDERSRRALAHWYKTHHFAEANGVIR